jgi:hypothetical protein
MLKKMGISIEDFGDILVDDDVIFDDYELIEDDETED